MSASTAPLTVLVTTATVPAPLTASPLPLAPTLNAAATPTTSMVPFPAARRSSAPPAPSFESSISADVVLSNLLSA